MNPSEIKSLTDDLRSLNARRRESALERICALPENDAIEMLLTQLEERNDTRFPNGLKWSMLVMTTLFVLPICFMIVLSMPIPSQLMLVAPLAIYLPAFVHFWLVIKMGKSKLWVIPLLPEYSDVRLVTPCLNEWRASAGKKRDALQVCLVRNLPLLTPEIADPLTTAQRKQLRELVFVESPDLQSATLEALLRIEDTGAIPTVERWVKKERNAAVKSMAERGLERLREIRAAEQASGVLLRPSHDTSGEKTLLRMTVNPKSEDEAQLLRPGTDLTPRPRPSSLNGSASALPVRTSLGKGENDDEAAGETITLKPPSSGK